MFYGKIKVEELHIDPRELSRRLMSSEDLLLSDSSGYKKLLAMASPEYAVARVPINRSENGIFIGDIFTKSKGLLQVAKNSDECFIMVCTLGLGVDKLILRESYRSVSEAFTIDAIADAMIEALCDEVERIVNGEFKASRRFSPGYSDLPLSVGKDIVGVLGAEAKLGIRFTESGMMIPKKSVSAIICIDRKD